MAASVKPERLTERQFVNGWASAPRVRIRQARPGDVDAVAKLAPLAGPMLDPDIAAAVDGKTAGSGFRVGLRRGREAFLRHMADQFGAHAERGEHFAAYLHAALVLVAEHRDHGIVGTLIANPPATVAATYLEQVGGDPVRQQGAWISCGTGVAAWNASTNVTASESSTTRPRSTCGWCSASPRWCTRIPANGSSYVTSSPGDAGGHQCAGRLT